MENQNKNLDIALLVLRVGLAIVFFLFGYHKLANPSQTTAEIQLMLNLGLGAVSAINYYMGLAEVTVALGLIFGVKTRLVGLAAAFMTTGILVSFLVKFGVSINPDLYRDVGLTAIGIAIALLGAGKYSLDAKQKN